MSDGVVTGIIIVLVLAVLLIVAASCIKIVPQANASDQNFYADFGFNWFGPIPGREDDIFAAAFSVIENERGARESYSHYEGTLEITYQCRLTSAIVLQPDMQIFMNPGNGASGRRM